MVKFQVVQYLPLGDGGGESGFEIVYVYICVMHTHVQICFVPFGWGGERIFFIFQINLFAYNWH